MPTAPVWDGLIDSYIPDEPLPIDPSLALHADTAETIDPVTHEVLRHALWSINEEHGTTIERVSGSWFAHEAHDFNPGILTEDAEYVFFGPQVQLFSGVLDLPVKWILEHCSAVPGIEEGDMFLSNDPYIAAIHQSDVQLMCPVFHEGRLFCWVVNALHQYDMGGTTPGSFCADARDIYDEPTPIPPIKIVERGVIRPDLEGAYLRHSRQPQLLRFDLRAQIAGNTVARNRVLGLVSRYGAATVKAAMRRIIDGSERAFVRRLEEIPDGTWRHESWVETAFTGDRDVYKLALRVTKEGDRLIFDNEGSSPQTGALNGSYASWRATILSLINPFFCFDQMFAMGGPLRHLDFRPTPGTINCPTYPASVSNTNIAALVAGVNANVCLGQMMLTSEEMRPEVFAVCANGVCPMSSFSGVDADGNAFGTGFLDIMGGAIGAFPVRDGVDTGGCHWDPEARMVNVEEVEALFPVLYLYRREVIDSGGAGAFRGGNSGVIAVIPHGTEEIAHAPNAAACAVPVDVGLAGGHPGVTNAFALRSGTEVRAQFAEGRIAQSLEEAGGTAHVVLPKQRGIVQGPDDIWELTWSAAGGYGDPLKRDPEAVAGDVAGGAISAQAAESVYGVVLGAEADTVDVAQTNTRRQEIRRRRLADAKPWQGEES